MRKVEPIDSSKMIKNPFSVGLAIKAVKVTDVRRFLKKDDGVLHAPEYYLEKTECARVYYGAGVRDSIYKLSSCGQSMLWYIVLHLEKDCDYLRINSENYMSKCGIKSINTYKTAIKELMRYCFIAPSADYKDVYWINPEVMFNGDRLKKFTDKMVIVSEILAQSKKG